MDILKLNKITNKVEFIIENLLMVNEFEAILKRNVAVFGDESTKERKYNYMEFRYIFHMADWSEENYLRALSDKAKHLEAVKDSGLSRIPGWTPDKLVKEAILKYIEIQQTRIPTSRYLIAAEKALMQAAQYLEMLNIQNEEMADKVKELTAATMNKTGVELSQGIELLNAANKMYQENIARATDTITSVDKAEERIAQLRKKVTSELAKSREVVGGGSPFNRETPVR